MKRVVALNKYFSGVAGEARVAAELVRYGFRVANPYWTDDEIDLLILEEDNNRHFPIPIQVKTVQFLPNKKGEIPPKKNIQGFKKKYLKAQSMCLAIYRPDTDQIWFITGNEKIISTYEKQGDWNNRHKKYKDLGENDDVKIYVYGEDNSFYSKHTSYIDDFNSEFEANVTIVTKEIKSIVKKMYESQNEEGALSQLWKQ